MDGRKRIAVYGGTFDPVHLGHVGVARKVTALFEIDELLFVPARVAPHKLMREVTPAIHRYAMLALATQQDSEFRVSTLELESPGRHFTIDTLAHLELGWGDSSDLFFIMGADAWSEITTWHDWERLLAMVNHIVVTRPGYEVSLNALTLSLRSRIVDMRGSEEAPNILSQAGGKKIFFTDAVTIGISATEIRYAAREDDLHLLTELVPPPVADYIRKYRLYRESNEA